MIHATNIGPAWMTDDACRVMELLREKHIPFDTAPEKELLISYWLRPNTERKWSFMVPANRLEDAVSVLAAEELINPDMLAAG